MDYRLYREDDFAQLYDIELACFEPPIRFSRQTMRRFLADTASATWIAEEQGQIAGFGIVYWAQPPEQPLAYGEYAFLVGMKMYDFGVDAP